MRTWMILVVAGAAWAAPPALRAQRRVTLAEAEAAALSNGSRIQLAAADAALARATLLTARAFPNPSLSAVYSKAVPEYHVTADQPLEFPWLRSARIRAAEAGALGARYRLEIERAAVRYQVDSLYVQAAAAQELATLSARTAREGAELVRIARVRRDAGDASDLDVELALVSQGGLENAALTDSLAAVSAILDLQALMGLPSTTITITIAETLAELAGAVSAPPAAAPMGGVPGAPGAAPGVAGAQLRTVAAQADVAQQTATVAQERANRWAAPSIMAGVEWHDPGQPGYLPTFGITIPLPIWDRNRGPIAAAQAGLQRARAALAAAQREGAAALAAAERNRAAARVRLERDRALLEHANRVVAMSTQGYREGAFPITTVLDAQRAARDALRQFVQDLAALRAAESAAALARTVGS
ncbi:MAG TPA: TolC family protein, partial [Longimicrobium sp.]|nr:TolC family protein [Longimicrobium sp.]